MWGWGVRAAALVAHAAAFIALRHGLTELCQRVALSSRDAAEGESRLHCDGPFQPRGLTIQQISAANKARYLSAASFLASDDRGPLGVGGSADLLIAVSTAQRSPPHGQPQPHFLTQSLAEVRRQMGPAVPSEAVLCVAGSSAETTAQLTGFLPHHTLPPHNDQPPPKVAERRDYSACLRTALSLHSGNASWLLLLEDDALLGPAFFPQLAALLRHLRSYELRRGRAVAYVKLHHPESLRKLPWMAQAAVASALLGALVPLAASRLPRPKRPSLLNLALLWLLQTALLAWAQHCLGQHLSWTALESRLWGSPRLSSVESCCTVGVLYSRAGAQSFLAALEEAERRGSKEAKDTVLDSLAGPAFQTTTNLLRHIGAFSSLHNRLVQPDHPL